MSRSSVWVSLLLLGMAASAQVARAQCQGYAVASTGETIKQVGYCDPFSDDLKGALTWTLSISCVDACGEVWSTIPPQHGSADAACSVIPAHYCSPEWYRYNYANGLYAETSAWNMKVFSGCQTDYQTITSSNCGCAPQCTPYFDKPSPTPCSGTPDSETAFLGVEEATSADLASLPSGFFTDRREAVDGVTYVMEDWAVVRMGSGTPDGSRSHTVAGSSVAPLAAKTSPFAPGGEGRAGGPDGRLVLVVEAPVHPDNSRMIPTPQVELRPAALPFLGERITAAVRIDVAEDREIREVRLLYGTGTLPGGLDLEEHLRANLRLRYGSEKEHRVIVYGLLDLEAGRARLRESLVVVPLCCCNPICV